VHDRLIEFLKNRPPALVITVIQQEPGKASWCAQTCKIKDNERLSTGRCFISKRTKKILPGR